jgi:hypothetical protein
MPNEPAISSDGDDDRRPDGLREVGAGRRRRGAVGRHGDQRGLHAGVPRTLAAHRTARRGGAGGRAAPSLWRTVRSRGLLGGALARHGGGRGRSGTGGRAIADPGRRYRPLPQGLRRGSERYPRNPGRLAGHRPCGVEGHGTRGLPRPAGGPRSGHGRASAARRQPARPACLGGSPRHWAVAGRLAGHAGHAGSLPLRQALPAA